MIVFLYRTGAADPPRCGGYADPLFLAFFRPIDGQRQASACRLRWHGRRDMTI